MSRAKRLVFRLAVCLLLAAPLVSACGKSAPVRFYSLGEQAAKADQPRPDGPCLALGVGPVDLPAYLDRTQIVTRGEGNRMHLADFDQWIEPLQANFTAVLQDALGTRVCAEPLVGYPWPDGVRPDRQISVHVRQFDAALGQNAVLRADWSVAGRDGRILVWKSTTLTEPCQGADYAAMAAAQGRLVLRLADEVAAAIPR